MFWSPPPQIQKNLIATRKTFSAKIIRIFLKYKKYTMSYFYNSLLKQNLQKNTGGGGDPDYSKIKGSLIKGLLIY